MRNDHKFELLSPAGDLECLKSAVSFGADAVYLAGTQFGMRTASKNFTDEELAEGIAFAHERGAAVHITCNVLPRSYELPELPAFLSRAQELGADAFIIADLGVLELAKKYAPNVEIHASTQTGIVNYATANALYKMGVKRVVLARELSIPEIAEIRRNTPDDLEIETFVHGSMCVSFSGRCIISSYMTGRDANRGDCAQPCRWKYHLYEENREGQYFPIEQDDTGTYLYNSRDLCMIDHLPELLETGVKSLKIEGRAKSSYYTSAVTKAYSGALREYEKDPQSYKLPVWARAKLFKVSHREYSTGFFLGGEPGQATQSGGYIREYDVAAVCESVSEPVDDAFVAVITQRNKFLTGDTLDVLCPELPSFETTVLKLTNEHGEEVQSAPHAMEKLTITTDKAIPQGAYLRKKRA